MKIQVKPKVKKALVKTITSCMGADPTINTRKQEVVNARMIYYVILKELNYGYTAISKSLNKNHATVIHGIRTFNDLIGYDKELRRDYDLVKTLFLEEGGDNPLQYKTHQELINTAMDLENQIKSLNLFNERLKDSLNSYKKYDDIVNLIKERNVRDESLDYIKHKLKHILNGLHDR